MAYPNQIGQSNVGLNKDAFNWFRNSLLNYIEHQDSEDYYDRWQQFIQSMDSNIFPISKSTFYNLVILYFPQINGAEILTYSQTNSGWSFRMCNDWGKLKSIELALFGNTTSTSGNTLPAFNGQRFLQSIPNWTISSLSYLRFALVRFNTYGTGIIKENPRRPAPAINIVDSTARTVSWHYALGYPNPSDYEYLYPGYAWQTATSNPIVVPGNIRLEPGDMLIRTRGDGGYIQYSESISNYAAIPLNATRVFINYVDYISFPEPGFNVFVSLDSALGQTITVRFYISFETTAGPEPMYLGSGNILAGNTFGTIFVPYDSPSIPYNIEGTISDIAPNPVAGRWVIW